MSKDIIILLHGIVSKKVLTPGWGDGDTEGLILTVVSTDRRGQAAALLPAYTSIPTMDLGSPSLFTNSG